jgi:zinc and cadmium transporter
MSGAVIYLVIVFGAVGSVLAVAGSALLLTFPARVRQALLPSLLSYATGTLLGAAFLGLIPNALEMASPLAVSATLLVGILIFFAAEKLMLWRHCHDGACERHGSAARLILVGDAVHNAGDGFVIASAFLTSIPLGIAVSLAVLAHELPQEVGDFAILLDGGYPPRRALAYNLISALPTLFAAVGGYYWLDAARQLLPFVLALSAASFIYIAVADLIPALHRRTGLRDAFSQFALLLGGIGTILLVHRMM